MQKVDMKHFLSAEERHYKYKFFLNLYLINIIISLLQIPLCLLSYFPT